MNQFDYAYGVAYIRAIENKLLSRSDIENLITAKSPSDVLKILADKGYGDVLSSHEDFESVLSQQLNRGWEDVRFAAPKGISFDILLYKNDFHNLKVAVKGVQMGISDYKAYVLEPNTVDFESMVSAAAKADFSLLPDMLSKTAEQAYDVLTRTEDSQLCDIIIDRASMDYTMQAAADSENDFLIGYVSLINTLANIKIAVRCAKTDKDSEFLERAVSSESNIDRERLIKAALSGIDALLEFLDNCGYANLTAAFRNSVTEFEKAADNMVTDYMKKSHGVSFGIEPLIAYIHKKQLEIQTVRIIMSAKLNDFDAEQIRARIRELA